MRIFGRVQGVGFRAWTVRRAQECGLDGWVRNHRDGSVEAVIAGPREQVARMLEGLRCGPPAARVERLVIEDSEEEVPPGFDSRPTV